MYQHVVVGIIANACQSLLIFVHRLKRSNVFGCTVKRKDVDFFTEQPYTNSMANG
jgi:hypothetical protein